MPTPHEICTALRTYRIRARLGQYAVAKCLGVAHSQVSRWESGRDMPRPHNVDAIRRLIWGPETDPLLALRHFVTNSDQNLLLFDAAHTLIARAQPFAASPNDLDRFGWVLDPRANPAFAPAYERYRRLLADPHGVIGLTILMPFTEAGTDWVARVRKTIYAVSGYAVCLAELAFAPGYEARLSDLSFEEVRLSADGRPRQSKTLWRQAM